MPLVLDDPHLITLADRLAAERGVSREEAVRLALQEALGAVGFNEPERAYDAGPALTTDLPAGRDQLKIPARDDKHVEAWRKLRLLQAEIAAYPRTGLVADKAFYDSLNDE